MFIDTFATDWQERLHDQHMNLPDGARLYLLLDGVFVPDLYREIQAALSREQTVTLLFESLPTCSDKTRAVSPFLFSYSPATASLVRLLNQCSRWPMVSAIQTTENLAELTARLSAWCLVENDGQRFNFRFPDTRRLPGIFDALTDPQRGSLAGPATQWSYIDRDGAWKDLPMPFASDAVADRPQLSNEQFGKMVADSEADEVITFLQDRGPLPEVQPSEQYGLVHEALRFAESEKIEIDHRVAWCDFYVRKGVRMNDNDGATALAEWSAANSAVANSLDI